MADITPSQAGVLHAVAAAMATPGCTAEDLLKPIADHLTGTFELGLVTITERDPSDDTYLRLFSSMPGAYEPQGRKPGNKTDWSRHVIEEHRTFVANDYEGVARVMFDHEKIRSLGLESILNIPVVVAGEVVGTLNCLGPSGHITDAVVAGCEAMRPLVATALLMNATHLAKAA